MYGSCAAQRMRAGVCAAAAGALLVLSGCSGSSNGDARKAEPPQQRPKSLVPYWVNPDGNAAKQVAAYRKSGHTDDAKLISTIADHPVAEWIGPDNPEGEIRGITAGAAAADREALLVLYNIPHRDCQKYSQGGAGDGNAYLAWLDRAIKGIGDRAATIMLEPDALPHVVDGCTPQKFHEERFYLLTTAVKRLKALPHVKVYLDAGNPAWITDPAKMAEPLKRAGVAQADGFALNISNYQTTEANTAYGRDLSALVGGKPFVIDTSRNGNGPAPGEKDPEVWCNPAGRALGERPTTKTGDKLIDAYLWVKRPGESDGTCKGGPPAGRWWADYALDLARNTQERDNAKARKEAGKGR
ncbi:glycoside hydrolase family 6 protein [Streptomyces sp. XD-27]|uniref:glycoside hydrolase family 6 protein n=1 Tax=Streptomyces sp. XD-27 TaxID=3062779 RepID=UPI0026F4448D|nr:glycoside hydrolase family 6 protein [Streptomyces sp. XD-27]WKX70554.1 glycoside hydrolase family 6 protein [Streptomyces sp. XD-27]